MPEFLKLNLATYNAVVLWWGGLGIVSALAIHFTGLIPISNRRENKALAFFGTMDKRLGWIVMETPILLAVLYFYFTGSNAVNFSAVMVAAFALHYVNRALIFPHRIKVQGKTIAISMVLTIMTFYIINGYLIGYYFGSLRSYSVEWLADPRFILGAAMFVAGFAINIHSDTVLINLRGAEDTGYSIPRGGMFNRVSCPNYFGEIVEWVGFAIMTWSLPAAMYAAWVALTLLSTGMNTHRWYRETFATSYPAGRKAVIPYIL